MESRPPSRGSIASVAVLVFAAAVCLRISSCYESLWLDELHSAWTVWGDLSDVASRADQGHQSPFYFLGLWCWKQAFGGSELALRMSSVLAVAIGCVVLTVGVSRWGNSVIAGFASGMVLAIESNSIFFGTELRPYAFVILFASIAGVCFLRLVSANSRHDDPRTLITFVVAILLAVLSQPTAAGVLAWLPMSLVFVWAVRDRQQLLKFSLLDGLLATTTVATGLALWSMTLGESWQQRSNWASFAKATRVEQIWETWDWTWLVIAPLALLSIAAIVAQYPSSPHRSSPVRRSPIRDSWVPTLCLALAGVAATSLFWVVSRTDLVPVWHRRYFIAVLPLLAIVVGGSIGGMATTLRPSRIQAMLLSLAAAAIVVGLAHHQGTLRRLTHSHYPVALVSRGENWRDAIAWVRTNAGPDDVVYVESGLIEDAWIAPYLFHVTRQPEELTGYHRFPVSGPYEIGRPIFANRPQATLRKTSPQKEFQIIRRAVGPSKNPSGRQVIPFGNVSVVVVHRQPSPRVSIKNQD